MVSVNNAWIELLIGFGDIWSVPVPVAAHASAENVLRRHLFPRQRFPPAHQGKETANHAIDDHPLIVIDPLKKKKFKLKKF